MNILILANNARGSYRFFHALAHAFEHDNHGVHIAVDCPYSAQINRLHTTHFPVHQFSTYLASHSYDQSIMDEYAHYNLNNALLSDYDRARTFGYWTSKPAGYFDNLKTSMLGFFSSLIKNHKIDVVLYENVSDTFAYYAWFVCQHLDIAYCGLTSSRLPGRFTITGDPFGESTHIAEALDAIIKGKIAVPPEVSNWCMKYMDAFDNQTPDYMKLNGLDRTTLTSNASFAETIRVWAAVARFALMSSQESFEVGNPLRRRIGIARRTLGRKWKAQTLHRYYSNVDDSDKYVLYPLHYHPEASTSVLASAYMSEYEIIRNIAFNLPDTMRLYVKDHISAFGFPSTDFYSSISSLPNVRVIHPKANTKNLIRKAMAVVTLTSTVGYEALLLGKRVFLLGRAFYELHRDVVKVLDLNSLFDLLRDCHIGESRTIPNSEYNNHFLEAYYLNSYPGILNMTGKNSSDVAKSLYPYIIQHLRRRGSLRTAFQLRE